MRNEEIFRGIKVILLTTLAKARALDYSQTTQQHPQRSSQNGNKAVLVPTGSRVIQIDGSWDVSKLAGIGMVMYDAQGNLERVQCSYLMARNPLQVEAVGLNQILEQASGVRQANRVSSYRIFSDSKILVRAISSGSIEEVPSWQAAQAIARSIKLVRQLGGNRTVQHVERNYVRQTHNLANWARRAKKTFNGYPSEGFREITGIDRRMGKDSFAFEEQN